MYRSLTRPPAIPSPIPAVRAIAGMASASARPPTAALLARLLITLLAATALLFLEAAAEAQEGQIPVIGQPCEGCEAVFVGMPDELSWRARIAPKDEPGEPMVVQGIAYDPGGDPASGVIIYAYHTDATGVYPPAEEYNGWARRHGELRAWVRTDGQGRYRFDTIRPASYPNQAIPAHVHLHVIEPDCCTYYISSIHFTDDPLLDSEAGSEAGEARGGSGLVDPRREDGVWIVERDIRLGQAVPGYRQHRPPTAGP
jgi:protocatechuate 3,4-dioxygenase beta subunit